MSAFFTGFTKTAVSWESVAGKAKSIGKGLSEVGKGALEGGREAMKSSVGDALKLKGLSHISDAAKQHGMAGLKTPAGQKAIGQAIGKAAPSIAAGSAYAMGAKKVYDKATGSGQQQPQYYY